MAVDRELRVPEHRGGQDQHSHRDHRPRAVARRQRLGDTGPDDDRPRGREERDSGLDRRPAEYLLDVEGQHQEVREDHGTEEETDDVCAEQRPNPEDPERHQRRARAALDQDEHRQDRDRGEQQQDRPRRPPANVGRFRDRVHQQRQPAGDGDRAGHVEAVMAELGTAFGNERQRQREHERSDRDVDEEDPLPAEVLGQDPADEHARGGAGAAESAPDPERLVPLRAFLEGGRHDRQGGGRDDRRADALDSARADQHRDVVGEAADERGDGEDDEPEEEDPLAAEQVGHPAAEQEEAAERDRIGDQHPLDRRLGDVQVGLDRRDRDVHDRDVEDGHEERGADDREDQPAAVGGGAHPGPA